MRRTSIFILSALGLLALSCAKEFNPSGAVEGDVELRGITPMIINDDVTKAVTYKSLGRNAFASGDSITITLLQRTENPCLSYTQGIPLVLNGSTWERTTTDPERIYWSDPTSEHTLVAYSAPNAVSYSNKLKKVGNIYYSSIGNPENDDPVDYTAGNSYLAEEDLMVSFNKTMKPNVDALLLFKHALSAIKVTVNITEFSSYVTVTSEDIKVQNLRIKNFPCIYKWEQDGFETKAVEKSDSASIAGIWGGTAKYDKSKDVKLWIPVPEGDGTGLNKTFSYYGLMSPSQNLDSVGVAFEINYQDPLKPISPANRITKSFYAKVVKTGGKIDFVPGYCTNINISLSHAEGEFVTGVSYSDWKYAEDQSSSYLEKNDLYLSTVDRSSVFVHSDAEVDLENATWLYDSGTEILDTRGNDGNTLENAYVISSASQLLSFAYEVKEGFDFTGKFVAMDAEIVMQSTIDESPTIEWIGIGDADNPFNGNFVCKSSKVTRHYGAPFFSCLGPDAVVEGLRICTIEAVGKASVADVNEGLIFASSVEGDVIGISAQPDTCGSIVSINKGLILGCSHLGNLSDNTYEGGIAGRNLGSIIACFNAGKMDSTTSTGGTVGCNETEGEVFGCFYDKTLLSPILDDGSAPKSTSELQKKAIVGDSDSSNEDPGNLNGAMHYWLKNVYSGPDEMKDRMLAHNFSFSEGDYPTIR